MIKSVNSILIVAFLVIVLYSVANAVEIYNQDDTVLNLNGRIVVGAESGNNVKFVQLFRSKLSPTFNPSGKDVKFLQSFKNKLPSTFNPSGNDFISDPNKFKFPLTYKSSSVKGSLFSNFHLIDDLLSSFSRKRIMLFNVSFSIM